MSALDSLYGSQFTLLNQLIKPKLSFSAFPTPPHTKITPPHPTPYGCRSQVTLTEVMFPALTPLFYHVKYLQWPVCFSETRKTKASLLRRVKRTNWTGEQIAKGHWGTGASEAPYGMRYHEKNIFLGNLPNRNILKHLVLRTVEENW